MSLERFDPFRVQVRTALGTVAAIDTAPVAAADDPLLFVHGVGTNGHLWGGVIDALARERRCIAIDLPGHGLSPVTDDQDLTLDGLADLVEAFCAAAALDTLDLVAHDTGGAVAQIFAARHPERLRSLTLTNCETHDNIPPPAFAPTVDLARAGELAPGAAALLADIPTARAMVFAMGYENPEHLDEERTRDFLEPILGDQERALAFQRLVAGLEPSALLAVEPALRGLDVPTLVVWATGDEFFDVKWAHWLRDTIPGVVDVVTVPEAKLFFPDERPADLVAPLRAHLDSASRAATPR